MIQITTRDAPTTIVAFSGLGTANHIYEWSRLLARFRANVIGVIDPMRTWYQQIGFVALAEVRDAISQLGTRHLLCVGASAGGFAALLFGKILGADCILAFCPQSACGEAKRALGDGRWPQFCEATPSCDIAGHYPQAQVHYAMDSEIDERHAARLDVLSVRRWAEGGHDLPKLLKERGLLGSVLEGVLP